jgi:hypothetical protein
MVVKEDIVNPMIEHSHDRIAHSPELSFIVGGYEIDGTPRIFGLHSFWDFSLMLHDYGFAVQGVAQ